MVEQNEKQMKTAGIDTLKLSTVNYWLSLTSAVRKAICYRHTKTDILQ